jgi:hypothetical protein
LSFLNQLKSQASALQAEQGVQHLHNELNSKLTEAGATTTWLYLAELAKQLTVIEPAGPTLSLDGKTPWPPMKLVGFRVDARKKKLFGKEVFDYMAMGWRIVPQQGSPVAASVSANFPPMLEKIEAALALSTLKHERVNVRHPEKNTLQAIRFDYVTETRGSLTITANHEEATLLFRVNNAQGFTVTSTVYPAKEIQTPLLDQLAKLIVGQPSSFLSPGDRYV